MSRAALFLLTIVISVAGFAQQKDQERDKDKPAPTDQKPVFLTPSQRLAAAKNVYLKQSGGSEVPYNVFVGGLEGWGRYVVVDSPERADIIIDINSPDDDRSAHANTDSKTKVKGAGAGNVPEPSNMANYDGPIRVVVSDAHTHLTLWAASEQPKGGFRARARDEHIVESAQRLLAKFRERVEPTTPAAKAEPNSK